MKGVVFTEFLDMVADRFGDHVADNLIDDCELTLNYKSTRPLADLAQGLILGCIAYFKEDIDIQRVDVASENTLNRACFNLVIRQCVST
jgi:hypothetical protein